VDGLVTATLDVPALVPNRIGGVDSPAADGGSYEKHSPHDGRLLWSLSASNKSDIEHAIIAAQEAQPAWARLPGVKRGEILHALAELIAANASQLAAIVAAETGKSQRDALGEVGAAVAVGRFFAGEGQRLFGRTMPSSVEGRLNMTVRQPIGVAGLIVAANTPIANVAWKVFPSLVCGNASVLKAPEDAPATAWFFARLAEMGGVPEGVLSVVQGLGEQAGAPLVADDRVAVVSFTGSTAVGRQIAQVSAQRLARVSLELGGKNPFVVCADADIDEAVHWAALSAFSNAGQRCAAGSRLIVHQAVYDEFLERLLGKVKTLRLGPTDQDDLGPVINPKALARMLDAIDGARAAGLSILCGGHRLDGSEYVNGSYIAPTVVEDPGSDTALSETELFGPITVVHCVENHADALRMANRTPYGLTAAVHTRDFDRAMTFADAFQAGVVSVNGGTFGSEPHMPFGGRKASGNGSREPGTEALDVYSELKNICLNVTRRESD
jgi:acyl-CoA reductase-like NAD-dependent aldehyde dehydrogenase